MWWFRNTRHGLQRFEAVFLCKMAKQYRLRIEILGTSYTRNVDPEKVKKMERHEFPENKINDETFFARMSKMRDEWKQKQVV